MSIKLQFALVGLSLVAAVGADADLGAAVVGHWNHNPYLAHLLEGNVFDDGENGIAVDGPSLIPKDSQLTINTFGSEVSGFPSGRRAYRHGDGPSRTTECFETRVGYGGRNLRKGEVKGGNPKKIKGDVKECQAMCASTYGCNFFTFRGNECTLMSEVLIKGPDEIAISGSNKDTCAENGIPIFGMIQGFEPNTGRN